MDRMQIRYGILKSHQVSRGESATNVHIPSQQTGPMGYGGKTTDDHKVHMVSNQTRQQAFKIFHGVFSPAPFQAPAPHSKRGNAREFVPAAFCAGWLRATTYPPHKPAPFPTPSFSHTPAFSLSPYVPDHREASIAFQARIIWQCSVADRSAIPGRPLLIRSGRNARPTQGTTRPP